MIRMQVENGIMPLANTTKMTQQEREKVVLWVDQGAKID